MLREPPSLSSDDSPGCPAEPPSCYSCTPRSGSHSVHVLPVGGGLADPWRRHRGPQLLKAAVLSACLSLGCGQHIHVGTSVAHGVGSGCSSGGRPLAVSPPALPDPRQGVPLLHRPRSEIPLVLSLRRERLLPAPAAASPLFRRPLDARQAVLQRGGGRRHGQGRGRPGTARGAAGAATCWDPGLPRGAHSLLGRLFDVRVIVEGERHGQVRLVQLVPETRQAADSSDAGPGHGGGNMQGGDGWLAERLEQAEGGSLLAQGRRGGGGSLQQEGKLLLRLVTLPERPFACQEQHTSAHPVLLWSIAAPPGCGCQTRDAP